MLTSENMSKSVLVRVYYLNLQPWYISYELPEYLLANFWVNAKNRIVGLKLWPCHYVKGFNGKRGFCNGRNLKIVKSLFLPEQYINMGQWYTKRCRIVTLGWGSKFFLSTWENHDFIFLMKIYTKSTFLRKHSPPMLIFRIFWYTLDQYWWIVLVENGISKFSDFPSF